MATAGQSSTLQQIVVIGTTPVPGTGIDAAKIPSNVQTILAADLTQDGSASLSAALNNRLGSISITDTLADPFQPDILYRGFEASPVLGSPQGLAVYQNGARINEAFGDAVNWDLIPDLAISRIDLVAANPSFGLNALGGAIAITMKNAFNFQGREAELSGGSFNQRAVAAQVGANDGRFGFYAAANVQNQDGWRRFASDSVHRLYADFSVRSRRATVDASLVYANNRLFGQGAAPVQELAISRRLDFTGPQGNEDRLNFFTLDAAFAAGDRWSLQSALYARNYDQSVANGNSTKFTACLSALYVGALCQADGRTPLVDAAGAIIPDISSGGTLPIGENDFEAIDSRGLGGSLQVSSSKSLFAHGNHFTAGVAVDTARIQFSSGAAVGKINAALLVSPQGFTVDTAESSAFPATPVDVGATSRYGGFYATDTFDAGGALSITASGRYNTAELDFADHRGGLLTGHNRFEHFNPALGATYQLSPRTTLYADYAITNRTPTMSEIECSDPLKPCVLPANLAGDPPTLKQVVAHTAEVGIRGNISNSHRTRARSDWNLSLFRTNLDDDIYALAGSLSTGYFQNIGSTRRQGLEAGWSYHGGAWSGYAQYSYVEATFQSPFTESSRSNPHQDANGDIRIRAGDRLPGIPLHRIKIGADYRFGAHCAAGGEFAFVSGQYYRGDESNQNPPLPGYAVMNVHASYRIGSGVDIFASINNLLNNSYATFGLYSDPTGVGAPGIPAGAASNDPRVDNRFFSPAPPRAFFGGIRARF